jgi:hypothetical protein
MKVAHGRKINNNYNSNNNNFNSNNNNSNSNNDSSNNNNNNFFELKREVDEPHRFTSKLPKEFKVE